MVPEYQHYLYFEVNKKHFELILMGGCSHVAKLISPIHFDLPNKIPHWQMHKVKMSALVGSPRFDETANGLKNGITSSLAIA